MAPLTATHVTMLTAVLLGGSTSCRAAHAHAATTKSAAVVVGLDGAGAPQPLPHTWKRIFGSGHAALGLREDWKQQLKQARDDLGLQGVRQHG